jgi:hypothetical protein
LFQNFLDNIYSYEDDNELVDLLYFESLKRFAEVQADSRKTDEVKHIDKVLIPFLTNWGLMSRVVGRKDIKWTEITEALRNLESHLKTLRGKKILSVDLAEKQTIDSIIIIYDKLRSFKNMGPTTLSKTLHLLNPQIFVMLDVDIVKFYKKLNPEINDSGEGYLEFLRTSQKEIAETLSELEKESGQKSSTIIQELCDKYPYCYDKTMKKTLAKFIDEYNWTVVPRKK